jgi:hypothetical protein
MLRDARDRWPGQKKAREADLEMRLVAATGIVALDRELDGY